MRRRFFSSRDWICAGVAVTAAQLKLCGYLPWLPLRSVRREPINIAAESRTTAKNASASIAGMKRTNITGCFPESFVNI